VFETTPYALERMKVKPFKGNPFKGEVIGLEVRKDRAGRRDCGVTEVMKVP